MKIMAVAPFCAAILGLALAQPVAAQVRTPPDTGNMAYPDPLPQGNFATYTPAGPNRPTDTGNMAYPSPVNPGITTRVPAQVPTQAPALVPAKRPS